MAKGYPSRKRARKAYWRGVKTARTGRGINPYRNSVLKELFERGRANPGGSAGLRPKSDAQASPLAAPPRPLQRDPLSRGRERGARTPGDPIPRRRF
jgi:hypothetical protein